MASCSDTPELDLFNVFVADGKQYPIQIVRNDEGDALFNANHVGAILGLTNVHVSIATFDQDDKTILTVVHPEVGHRETTFLSETGLYRLLMRSRKPIAQPFQKWITRVVKTIREQGAYALNRSLGEIHDRDQRIRELELAREQDAIESRANMDKARHAALVSAFLPDEYVVYIGKIRHEVDGSTLVKIGHTSSLPARANTLKAEWGGMCFVWVKKIAMTEQFEKFLQRHPSVLPHLYSEPVHEGRRSRSEIFKLTCSQLEQLMGIATRHMHAFNMHPTVEQLVQLELLRQQNNASQEDVGSGEIDQVSSNADVLTQLVNDTRRYTQARGPKIQRYTPDGKTLLSTYPGCAEVLRDANMPTSSAGKIREACQKCTVYKGFRWAALERCMPDDTVQDIGESVYGHEQRKGLVALLDHSQTHIKGVYMDMKDAALQNGMKNSSSVSSAITRNSRTYAGGYFRMWHDCSQEMKDAWLAVPGNELPRPRPRGGSKEVEQVNPLTNQVVRVFSSIAHIQTEMRISRASVLDAIEHGRVCKGSTWRYLESQE
jgi:prophage antirepressor-like protein